MGWTMKQTLFCYSVGGFTHMRGLVAELHWFYIPLVRAEVEVWISRAKAQLYVKYCHPQHNGQSSKEKLLVRILLAHLWPWVHSSYLA